MSTYESESSHHISSLSQNSFIQPSEKQLSSTPIHQKPPLSELRYRENMPSPIHQSRHSFGYSNTSMSRPEGNENRKEKPAKRRLDPLDDEEEESLSELLIRKIHNSSDPTSLAVRNGTRTMRYQHVPQAYVSAEKACDRTLRRRAAVNEKIRNQTQSKLSKELSQLSKDELVSECKDAGITAPHMRKEESVALKVVAGLSWEQNEIVSRMYTGKGVSHEGQGKQRKYRESLLGNHLETQMLPFKVKDENSPFAINGYVTKSAPCCRVKSLKDSLIDRLDRLNALELLTWHNRKIPDDQIWYKLNGDKGGGSTKCGFQIVNIAKPNSPANNNLFCTFEAPDSHANLQTALNLTLKKSQRWNGTRRK